MKLFKKISLPLLAFLFLGQAFAFAEELTIYSGRSEKLVGSVLKRFEEVSGIKLNVRYGKTPELAATLIEEGRRTPADIFYSQDAGALGALTEEGLLASIDESLLSKVKRGFVSSKKKWIGITGRGRTIDYNTDLVNPKDLPKTIWGLLDQKWSGGRIGWAPLNSSFQSFVAGLLVTQGEKRTRLWLQGIKANEPQVYPKNTAIVAALGRKEISVGLVNNYYLHRFLSKDPSYPVAHHYTQGDVGSMLNVAGIGILKNSSKKELAEKLIKFLLSEEIQKTFAKTTFEYPLIKGIEVQGPQKSLSTFSTLDLDLNELKEIRKAVTILKEEGVL
ncbi:hypothetical protein AB834_05485 [PVC group bacterium (ex Bugula neritina AB1)]|nr:hypothetical protein AB834_05485 [PVC group bacterium (ex Bugula neritina AB1)]